MNTLFKYIAAIPTIRRPYIDQSTDRTKRVVLMNVKKELRQLTSIPETLIAKNTASDTKQAPPSGTPFINPSNSPRTSNTSGSCYSSLNSYKSTGEVSPTETNVDQYRVVIDQQKQRITELENQIRDLQKVHYDQVLQKAHSILSKRYTRNQIEIMLGQKKKVERWLPEELSMGFTLKYLSKPALKFVVEKLQFPLPTSKCLESHAANINMRKGFFHEILQILEAYATTLPERDRVCVFLYDEMSVCEAYEYDRKDDVVLKPSSKMQVSLYKTS